MRKWWKDPKIIGSILYYLLHSLGKTLRMRVKKHVSIDSTQPYIFVFWHGTQLLPSLFIKRHHFTPNCVLVSPSRDGSMLTTFLQKSGFNVLRGSSRANNIGAIINLRRKMLQGVSIGTALDGPVGPIFCVKPGLVYLAQKYKVPIIPLGSAFSDAWVFNKAWDKFQIPKPFAKASLVLGQPFVVAKEMDIEQACAELAELVHATNKQALDLLVN